MEITTININSHKVDKETNRYMYLILSTFSHLFIKTFQNCCKPGPLHKTKGRIARILKHVNKGKVIAYEQRKC